MNKLLFTALIAAYALTTHNAMQSRSMIAPLPEAKLATYELGDEEQSKIKKAKRDSSEVSALYKKYEKKHNELKQVEKNLAEWTQEREAIKRSKRSTAKENLRYAYAVEQIERFDNKQKALISDLQNLVTRLKQIVGK